MKAVFNNELFQYVIDNSVTEHQILRELREFNSNSDTGHMQITPDQGQFMAFLAKLINAKNYLEIGVFTGYSSLLMALAMGKNSTVYALDHRADHIDIAKKYWDIANVTSQIQLFLDDALVSLHKMLEQNMHNSMDIAFIDAKKSDYKQYYECCYQLVRPRGLIIIDNVLMRGEVLQEAPRNLVKSIKEFNRFLHQDHRVEMCMLTIGDGLSIAYKKDDK